MSNQEPHGGFPSNNIHTLNAVFETERGSIDVRLVIKPDSIEVITDLECSDNNDFVECMKAIHLALFEAQKKILSDLKLKIKFTHDNSRQVGSDLVIPLSVKGLIKTETIHSFIFEPSVYGKFRVKYISKPTVQMVGEEAQIILAFAMCRVSMILLEGQIRQSSSNP
jgi:hypothetical protein